VNYLRAELRNEAKLSETSWIGLIYLLREGIDELLMFRFDEEISAFRHVLEEFDCSVDGK
jgi:hypothetical protein